MLENQISNHFLPLINMFQWMSGLILLSIAAYCHTQRKSSTAQALMFFCVLTGAWAFISAINFFQTNLEIASVLNRIKLVIVPFIAPSILWMVMTIVWQKKMNLWLKIFLAIMPLYVFVFNIGPWYELYLGQYSFVSAGDYNILTFKNGPYFFYQSTVSRLLILISMIMIFLRPFEAAKMNRLDRFSLLFSLLVPSIADTLAVFYFPVLRFVQLTPAFFIVSAGLIAKIVFRDKLLDVIPFARSLIIERSQNLILVFNKNQKLVDFNQKSEKILKLSQQHLSLSKMELAQVIPWINQERFCVDSCIYEKDVETLYDDKGDELGDIIIFKDMTLERTLQAELEDINSTKTKLLGILGHDLQGHLGVISILTEDLQKHHKEMGKEDIEAQLDSIHSSTRTSIEFVDELIRWTKADIGSLKVQREDVHISSLVDELYQFMITLFAARDIDFECEIPQDLILQSDPNLLKIILRNLLSNAIKFSKESSVVKLTTKTNGDFIEIQIKDSGTGLNQSDLDQLLTMKESERSGFGLLASLNFAQKLGGEIFAQGSKGQGCVFGLRIPRAIDHAQHKSIH